MKFKEYLDESKIGRIWKIIEEKGYTFVVISSFDKNLKIKTNNENHEKMRKELRSMGYGYIELTSKWINDIKETESEKSFFVTGMEKEDALNLGKKYNQYSVIWKDNNEFVEIKVLNGSVLKTYKKESGRNNLSIGRTDLYSVMKRGSHRNKRWTFKEIIEKHGIDSMNDAYRYYLGNWKPKDKVIYEEFN